MFIRVLFALLAITTASPAAFGQGFDLLFLVVDELPTTVPIALALAVLELGQRRRAARGGELTVPISEAA
jgi:hypothetical protein